MTQEIQHADGDRTASKEAMELAKQLAKKWWREGKISWKWDHWSDCEDLAYVIDNKKMLE